MAADNFSHSTATLEGQMKVRSDHELFLDAYEKPTQIYRFLRARHRLEPIFLQRNLSYMKERRSKRKLRKRPIKVNELAEQTTEKGDITAEIKSDNQLRITFRALDHEITLPNTTSAPIIDQPMVVEVLLYRFRQPSPEILLANPASLPCDCTILGKCLIPNADSPQIDKHSITIPGSVLSWRGTGGILGTHMLAFRVVPLPEEERNHFLGSPEKKQSRKRQQIQNMPMTNGSMELSPSHVTAINGYLHGTPDKKQLPTTEESPLLENGHAQNNIILKDDSRLHMKVPGGKILPTQNATPLQNDLVISISRNSLEADRDMEVIKSNTRYRRTQVQLLLDGDKPKNQCTRREELVPATVSRLTRSSILDNSQTVEANINPRKRPHSESVVSQTLNSDQNFSAAEPFNDSLPPPSKKPCQLLNSSEFPSPCHKMHSSTSSPSQNCEMYYAELVAFDSRQDCLLVDGEYELQLRKHRSQQKLAEPTLNGFKEEFSPFNLETLLGNTHNCYEDFPKENMDVVSLKLTVEWLLGPPKPRTEEVKNATLDFSKLRKKYEELISSVSLVAQSSSSTVNSALASIKNPTKPTVFNFMYNKNTLQQTELKTNCVCPWCSLDCKELYPLLKHLSLCHPRFLFTYSPVEGGANIDVRINRMYDSNPQDPVEDSLLRKKTPTKCQPSTSVLVRKKTPVNDDLSEFTASAQFAKPKSNRVFYHTHSCLPMLPNEKDSDEEIVPEWLRLTSSRMVDEFIDVNQGEKQFMKIWNLFMMDHMTIADKQSPHFCLQFARTKKKELMEKHLEYNLLCHVIYLCDIGLVPPATISEISKVIHGFPTERD